MRSPFDGINKKRHLEAAMGISTSEITQRFYRKLLRKASLKQSSLSKKLQFSTLEDRLQPAGTITGTTFLDYNANGVYNSTALTIPNASGVGSVALAADVGIGGVTVTAYDAAGVIQGTATSNTNGSYTLNAAGTGPYRIEFSNLPTGTVFGPSTTSAASGVQFVQDGTTGNVNLSVVRPESISSTTSPAGPQLVTQQYWFGSHDATRADGMNAAQATILDFNYNAGSADSDPNAANYQAPQTHNLAIPFSAVGATWGLAFNPASNSIYASAFAKRYSDFGPSGPGAIYQINGTSGTSASQVSTLVDLNAIFPSDLPAGKNFRTDPSWTGFANDGLTNNLGWGAIGTTGIGGLTVSPDGSRTFVIALGNRKLYSIPTSGPINASTIQSFTLPTPTNLTGVNVGTNGTLGDLRPFAVEYHNGKIYVGAVNSAQSTGNANDLKAYVFAFDPTTGNFVDAAGTATTTTPVFQMDLNFNRGIAHPDLGVNSANWNAWTSGYANLQTVVDPNGGTPALGVYPQPELTGLSFDASGNMILGFRDRSGDQFGRYSTSDPAHPNALTFSITAGDVLKAFANAGGTTWTLENNGNGTAGAGNNQGPGGGQYFYQQNLPAPPGSLYPNDHVHVANGGVLALDGYADILYTSFDPARVPLAYNTGGVRWANDTTGANDKGYTIYQSNSVFNAANPEPLQTFAKGNGMGDLIAIPVEPIEIGNFVWEDTNKNGIQDPGESGLPNVIVQLWSAGTDNTFGTGDDVQLGQATTDSKGNYLFSSQKTTTTASNLYNLPLTAGTSYQVRILLSQTGVGNRLLASTQVGGGTNAVRDSNAGQGTGILSNYGVFTLTTPQTGAADHTFDVGFVPAPTYSIGDFVWNDTNNNGVFDTSEVGLQNVVVNLLDNTGTKISSMKTDASGNYLFTGLPNNTTYKISIDTSSLPAGYVSSTGSNGSATGLYEPAAGGIGGNNTDHGTTDAGGATVSGTSVTINGADILTQDFGFFRPLSIGDFVWLDSNNNGLFDTGENGLSGFTVDLLNSTGTAITSQQTDSNGGYLFTNLIPGTYSIRVRTPAGYISSTGTVGSPSGPYEPGIVGNTNNADHGTESADGLYSVGTPIALDVPGSVNNPDNSGTANLRQDFGLIKPVAIGDTVWVDTNNDGILNNGESGINGVFVELLDKNGNVLKTTTTSGNGQYLFTLLNPDVYQIRITPPAGYISSTGKDGSGTGSPFEPGISTNVNNQDHGTQTGAVILGPQIDLTVGANLVDSSPWPVNTNIPLGANLTQDFGIFQPLSVGNFVWNDANNNGVLDTGEKGIQGVVVNLLNTANAIVTSTTTDANGGYLFTNLIPGTYQVQVIPTGNYISSTGTVGSATGKYEPGVNGTQNNEDHGTTSGTSILGGTFTLAAPGSSSNPDDSGMSNLRQDFGLFQPLSLGNFVFYDKNNNGVFDAGDNALSGVSIQLLDGAKNVIGNQTTDTNGNYLFTNLTPGTYSVQLTPTNNLISSTGAANSNTGPYEPVGVTGPDNSDHGTQSGTLVVANGIVLGNPGDTTVNPTGNGFSNTTIDFGLTDQVANAKVSGYVYLDPNINGIKETGERPFPGTTVTLTGTDNSGNTITRTTRTDTTGYYEFTQLPAGTYTVTETQPTGLIFDGLDTVGSLGGGKPVKNSLNVTLNNNDNGVNYNFGEIPPAQLFGFVYEDLNRNNKFDPGEPPIANTTITLSGTAFAGSVLSRPLTGADSKTGLVVTTDQNGRWEYYGLPPGNYTAVETQPAGYATLYNSSADSTGLPVTVGAQFHDVFSGTVAPAGVSRGAFNFGEIRNSLVDPTKRDFLGTTDTTNGSNGGGTNQNVNLDPSFGTSSGTAANPTFVLNAAGQGQAPFVRVFDYTTGFERNKFLAYESTYTGGVRVAVGDVNGDGVADIITATGIGGGPRIRVFSGADNSIVLMDFFAYESSFRGGVFVAAGDITGDGKADIIVGTESGGGPRVRVFSGADGSVVRDFFAFDSSLRTGVRVAAGDVNGDGKADIIATTGPGTQTIVRTYDGVTNNLITQFAPFGTFSGGAYIAAGNTSGGTTANVIVGADAGGGPIISTFNGATGANLTSAFAFDSNSRNGVRVAASDVNGDGIADVIVSTGPGTPSQIKVLNGSNLSQTIDTWYAFDTTFLGGTYVA